MQRVGNIFNILIVTPPQRDALMWSHHCFFHRIFHTTYKDKKALAECCEKWTLIECANNCSKRNKNASIIVGQKSLRFFLSREALCCCLWEPLLHRLPTDAVDQVIHNRNYFGQLNRASCTLQTSAVTHFQTQLGVDAQDCPSIVFKRHCLSSPVNQSVNQPTHPATF